MRGLTFLPSASGEVSHVGDKADAGHFFDRVGRERAHHVAMFVQRNVREAHLFHFRFQQAGQVELFFGRGDAGAVLRRTACLF